jgi:replicative DNA helicase
MALDPLIYDDEAESVVLGTMYGPAVAKSHVAYCIEVLDESDFGPRHRPIFRAIKAAFLDGEPLDSSLTVLHRLRRAGHLEEIGGPDYLMELLHFAPSMAGGKHHLTTVKWAARVREWQQLQVKTLSSDEDAEHLAEAAADLLANLKSGKVSLPSPLEAQVTEAFDRFEENAGRQVGLRSGLHKFDEVTGGFLPGQLIIVGARTSVGKTSLLVQFATAAARQDAKVLVLSLEMPTQQVTHRLLAQTAEVPVQHLTNPSLLSEQSWRNLVKAQAEIPPGIWLSDGSFTPDSLIAKIRHAHAQTGGLNVVVVDYIQLVRTAGKNRAQEIGEVSRSLKALANELGICILAASQLSRAHEHAGREPMLSDLRESGSLEHDADVVVLIHRPKADEKGPSLRSMVESELIVAKNRNGATGKTPAYFDAPLNRFQETA